MQNVYLLELLAAERRAERMAEAERQRLRARGPAPLRWHSAVWLVCLVRLLPVWRAPRFT